MRLRRDILGDILAVAAAIGVLVAYWIGSEVYYVRSISPKGILTARDFFHRFGEPLSVRIVTRGGQSYYEFMGQPPSAFLMATPSSPPSYVFDERGQFVTWCRDPGDAPDHRHQWPFQSTNLIKFSVVKSKFGL